MPTMLDRVGNWTKLTKLADIFFTKEKVTKLTETVNSSNSIGITVIVSIAIVVVSVVASITSYNLNDRNNMAKNIDSAIQKGVDPIAVKCSYETNTSSTCIAYSIGQKR